MEINDFLGIGIVGVALSLVIEWIKNRFGTYSVGTKAVTIGLSIVVGSAYFFLRDTSIWQTILGVLASASTFYALFMKPNSD